MAFYTFRKVNCIDPCDADGIMTRQLALLVQIHAAHPPTNTNLSRPLGWLAEPTLVNPVSMVKKITAEAVIQQIHVVDPVFGNQIVQYITDVEPSVHFSVSRNREEIEALWSKSVPAPKYTPGQARANPHFTPGEVKLDGARSDFTTSYNAKYPAIGDLIAEDIPIYCYCQIKGDEPDGRRRMIQCSNEERYCLKEWYHIKCIGMAVKDVPPGDNAWFCKECVEGRLGKLAWMDYVPWKRQTR